MLFKVTHIGPAGHRHRARVTANSTRDAMEQANREWGEARVMSCVRITARPVLSLVLRSIPSLCDAAGHQL